MKIRDNEHYLSTLKGYHFVKEESMSVESEQCMLSAIEIVL